MARIEPTEGQLQAAFVGARRPGWPEDLASALAHPLYGRLVRMNAGLLADGRDPFAAQRINHRPVVVAPEPPHPADAPAPRMRPVRQAKPRQTKPLPSLPAPPALDRKRAAECRRGWQRRERLGLDRKRAAAGDDD